MTGAAPHKCQPSLKNATEGRCRLQTSHFDKDAEQALLGSFLTDLQLFPEIDNISADDFSLSAHRVIYRAMAAMNEDNKPTEQHLLCDELRSRGELETIGGRAYIARLPDGCVPECAKEYAAVIRKKAEQRRYLNALEIAKSKTLGGESSENIWTELEAAFTDPTSPSSETLGHSYDEIVNAPPVTFAIDASCRRTASP
jgi:replicative DNA helicase